TAVGVQGNAGSLSPPSPAERSRLTKCFTTGSDNLRKGNYDYAIELFGSCVAGDPASAIYLQKFMEALSKKFSRKKKGGLASLLSAGSRGSLKRLIASGKTREALKTGLDVLKKDPFDVACLLSLADACGEAHCLETQGLFLRRALDVAPKDISVNKHCANYKERLGEYDQAISCWQRLAGTKSVREEADREIARLSVEKTRQKLESRGVSSKESSDVSPLEELRQKLAASPTDYETAFELSDLLEREASIEEAETVLLDVLAASGNDLKVREHFEDRQIRWAKQRLMVAEKQLQNTDSEDNKETVARLKTALLKQEIDVFAARVERYPDNVSWKYELAMRLKTAGSPAEAIKFFQQVQMDSRRRGAVALELGECFQKIKQYPLAMRNYQTAVESLGDREVESRKRALYRAGVLAAAMKDKDAALKFLSNLAELDFGYRDVAERLEKLNTVDS
ncbi:MAG: tetratricopeptide repeat protein, partial [Pirellulales bacterium]